MVPLQDRGYVDPSVYEHNFNNYGAAEGSSNRTFGIKRYPGEKVCHLIIEHRACLTCIPWKVPEYNRAVLGIAIAKKEGMSCHPYLCRRE